MAAIPDFARKLGLVLKACNLSRGRLAQTIGIDKSVVSRWASGVQVPTDHNLSLLTEAIARHTVGFGRPDWDLSPASLAERLGLDPPAAVVPEAVAPAWKEPGLALPDRPSIAVLPFQNMSGDPEQGYFADGIAEDIIAALSRFRSLFVIARNSSFTYAGRGVDVRQVGRELGVRYVLEGSVRRSGGKVRFTAQLIDATTNGHVWTDQHDGSAEDLFELQDRITEAVVGVIEPTIRQAEIDRVRRKRPDHMGAYDHYLRALSTTNGFTPQAVDASLAAALQAIATDPSFAPAYIFAARAHIQRFVQGWADDDTANGAAALDFIERGLKVDRFDAWLLATAGHCFVMFARDVPKGIAYTDEAIAINPNLFEAYLHGAWVRLRAGDTRIALDHLKKALRLSPRDLRGYAIYHSLSLAHLIEGDLATARSWADRSVQHNPNYMSGWYAVAACAALAGQPAQAREAAARVLALNPRFSIRRWVSQPHEPVKFAPLIRGMRLAGIPE